MRDYKNVEAVNPALEFAKGGISGACIALILYCIAASLVNDEPEEPKLYVKNSQVQQCMPENNPHVFSDEAAQCGWYQRA